MDIGICDDDMKTLLSLKETVTEYCKSKGLEGEVHLFASGGELLALSGHLDLLFLDIEMPGLDGIEVGKRFRRKNGRCKIVMETCREDRVLDAFHLEACRFLLKPLKRQDVWEALNVFAKSLVGSSTITLWEMRQRVEVSQRDIVYAQTYDSYTEYIVGDHLMRSERSLLELERELDPRLFFRINKKYIVNFSYIESYDNGELSIRKRGSLSGATGNLICTSGRSGAGGKRGVNRLETA